MLEVREENFVIYCIKDCGEVQKQKDRNVVFIEGSGQIIEYAEKNSLRAVPGPISRLVDAEQIVLTDVRSW